MTVGTIIIGEIIYVMNQKNKKKVTQKGSSSHQC